jgi:L-iditol 2-dehydrogenase
MCATYLWFGSFGCPRVALVHSHTFALSDLQTALHYARNRIYDAIKVVVKAWGVTEVREKPIA